MKTILNLVMRCCCTLALTAPMPGCATSQMAQRTGTLRAPPGPSGKPPSQDPSGKKPTEPGNTKTDEQVYAEFGAACRGAEGHRGFLLDPKSGKPLPIYITTPEPPPTKERRRDITNKVSPGMTRAHVREALGYPDDYLLKIEAGTDPNDSSMDKMEEAWDYGNYMLWFDRRNDRLVRIETKQQN